MAQARWADDEDESEDWEAGEEYESADDSKENDDEVGTSASLAALRCSSCTAWVPRIYDTCPHCGGHLQMATVSALAGRPKWFVWLGLIGVAGMIWVLVFPFL